MTQNSIFIVSCSIFISLSALLYFTLPSADSHEEIDSEEYQIVARTYATTGKLMHPQHGMPVHPIGYYWFMGLLYQLCNDNQAALCIIQCLLSLFCFFILYNLALLLFGAFVAQTALLLASFNLGFLVYSQLILAEILLATSLVCFVYTVMLFYHRQESFYCATSSLLLSASVLIKPVMLFFAPVMAFFVWFAKNGTATTKFAQCILFLILFYIPVIGYMFYNKHMFNTFAVTTLHTGNLYEYFLPRRILPQLEVQERNEVQQYLNQSNNAEERKQRTAQIFFDLFKKHPCIYFYSFIEGCAKVFFGLYATQLRKMYNTALRDSNFSFFSMQGSTAIQQLLNYIQFGTDSLLLKIISFLELCWILIMYFLICCAIILLLYKKNYFLLLWWGSYSGYIVCAAAFEGCGRYRMMFEPLLIILSAYALVMLYTWFKQYDTVNRKYYGISRA